MDERSDPTAVQLRRALGLDSDATGSAALVARRAREDAALAAWAAAGADHERAVRDRDQAVARAAAAVRQVMRPLGRAYYERIEACLDAGDWAALARFEGRSVAHVAATRDEVRTARARLVAMTVDTERAVEATRATRRVATENLIALLGLTRVCAVTGVGRRRLAAIRTGQRDRALTALECTTTHAR